MSLVDELSEPARLAEPDEGISEQELQLASRNHGLPLEALHYDITPVGLHYLLIHYDIPAITAAEWRLQVNGSVITPLTVDLDMIKAQPRRTISAVMECAGNGRARLSPRPISQPWLVEAVGNAEWTGTPLAGLLRQAKVSDSGAEVLFTGSDRGVERGVEQLYQRSLPLRDAMSDDVLLAYEMNGAPLPPQHGFPLRLIVPGWYGMAQVKWLSEITVIDEPFTGFQHTVAYRLRQDPDEPGDPVTRIEPRALIQPPGWPDFMSRTRFVTPGWVELRGRAWSGHGPISTVEISTDDGTMWHVAELDEPPGQRWAWRGWRYRWRAEPGQYTLSARATDTSGRRQPTDQRWNRGGFANNLVHRVRLAVMSE